MSMSPQTIVSAALSRRQRQEPPRTAGFAQGGNDREGHCSGGKFELICSLERLRAKFKNSKEKPTWGVARAHFFCSHRFDFTFASRADANSTTECVRPNGWKVPTTEVPRGALLFK
jgi:hypothetical protein